MENSRELDRLINEYSASLLKTYEKRDPLLKEETIKAAEPPLLDEAEAAEAPPEESGTEPQTEIEAQKAEETNEDALTDTATFFATVRTGGGAYPVPNAKIIVGKDDSIVSFLITDGNGDTPKVSLPAYPREDSLSSETARTVNYFADVYRSGFQDKKNLPVSAVGGAEIVLNVELTPNEERME